MFNHKMATLFPALLAAMLIGWSSATSPSRVRRDDSGNNTSEEQDSPEFQDYFAGVSEIMLKARGLPSNETARRVAEYNPATDTRNPEELGTYYEGDILWPLDEPKQRNGIVGQSSRWPNGIVPYRIAFGFGPLSSLMIFRAIMMYNSRIPCIRFIPRTSEKDYIHIINGKGCYSSVGRIGGVQDISVQSPGCTIKIGTILHELMHALGFLHEQSREDRDDYVDIHLENVMEGTQNNFMKAPPGLTTSFGVNYTYSSVMHYTKYAFSKNGQATVVPKPDSAAVIGQRDDFDPNDIKKLRAMYGCPA